MATASRQRLIQLLERVRAIDRRIGEQAATIRHRRAYGWSTATSEEILKTFRETRATYCHAIRVLIGSQRDDPTWLTETQRRLAERVACGDIETSTVAVATVHGITAQAEV